MLNSSLLEQEYLLYLQNEHIKIISFDIFETLAFRDVAEPTDIFNQVAKTKYAKNIFANKHAFKSYRIAAEQEARLHKRSSEDITLKQIYNYIPISQNERAKLMKLELSFEEKSIYINEQVVRWITLAHKFNKKILLISDMYLSKKHIKKIVLQKLKNKHLINNIFISNEEKVSKSTGNLYLKIKNKLQFDFSQQLHIGDNKRSDIHNAQNLGIHTLYYNLQEVNKEALDIEYKYLGNKLPADNNMRILSALQNPYKREDKVFFYNLGAIYYGPILWKFSYWLLNICKKYNIKEINFVMREGEIFKKFLKLIDSKIQTNLIYTSRAATDLASMNIKEIKKGNINFLKYKMLTIDDLYKKFKLQIDNTTILKYTNTDCSDAANILLGKQSILQLVYEDFFLQTDNIIKNIKNERKIIQKYIKQLNIDKNSITIDFGGNGTILTRLNKIFPNFTKYNGLFYMHENGYKTNITMKQFAFFELKSSSHEYLELIRRSPETIEILFNGTQGSTLSYRQNTKGLIEPVLGVNTTNDKTIQAFHNGIENYFKLKGKQKIRTSKKLDLLKSIARIIEIPTANELTFLKGLSFDIGGGSSSIIPLVSKEHIKNSKNVSCDNLYKNLSENLFYKKREIPWIHGLITTLDFHYILKKKGFVTHNNIDIGIHSILQQIEDININSCYIYGAGDFFKQLLPLLVAKNVTINSLIDMRANLKSYNIGQYNVNSLENSSIQNNDTIVIASAFFINDIVKNIQRYSSINNIYVKIIHI